MTFSKLFLSFGGDLYIINSIERVVIPLGLKNDNDANHL